MDADLAKLSPNERSELMDKVKTQVLVANFQEMLTTITDKCFAKCVQKPGSALDSSETKCLNLCMDRFMDAKQLVARTYLGRVSRESSLN